MPTVFSGQTTRPSFAWRPESGLLSYGLPYSDLLSSHLKRLSQDRVLLIVSKSFATSNPPDVDLLRTTIGASKKLVFEQIGLKPNSDWSECMDVAMKVYDSEACFFFANFD